MRQLEWITMAGIGALVSAIALTVSGVSFTLGQAQWGVFPAPSNPLGQLTYASLHPAFVPFVHGLAALSAALLSAVAGGLYLVMARYRRAAARLVTTVGVAGGLVVALSMSILAVGWVFLAGSYAGAATAAARAALIPSLHEITVSPWAGPIQGIGYLLLGVWIVAVGVLLWPIGRDVRTLALISILAGVATPFAEPALALWAFVVGIWLLSPGPRLALLRPLTTQPPKDARLMGAGQ